MNEEDYERQKAEAVKQKIAEKNDRDTVNFTVYDLPKDVKDEIISMAKLYYDNDASQVLEAAITSLKDDRSNRIDMLEARIRKLEARLQVTKDLVDEQKSENNNMANEQPDPTFGGSNTEKNTIGSKIEQLKQKGDN